MSSDRHAAAKVPRLAVLLLLGGRSSRMGQPKHLLSHPRTHKPLYQHHLETLCKLEEERAFPEGVFVGARKEQLADLALPSGVRVVLDDPETNGDIGPAAGILQAAAALPDATWLVLAVDLPFISRESILHLLNAHTVTSPVSLYLHSSDGNPEPLFSIWTPAALAQLRSNCRAGRSGPCRAAKDVWGGKIVPGKGGVEVPTEDWITDADTPEEWEGVQQRLRGSEGSKVVGLASPPTTDRPRHAFSQSVYKSIPFEKAMSRIRDLPPKRRRERRSPSDASVYGVPRSAPATSTALLLASLGQTSQRDIHAVFPHPLDDNSAMDGFAVCSSLLAAASLETPIELPVLGRLVAGDPPPPSDSISAAIEGCWEVMTGAVLPGTPFDAVVKVEDTFPSQSQDAHGRRLIHFSAPVKAGQHIRRRGEQFQAGQVILRAGERISPEKVMLLAAAGISSLPFAAQSAPARITTRRVAILATGKEVVSLDDLARGEELQTGQVVDCITPFLQAFLLSHDCEPILFPSAGDSTAALTTTLAAALRSEEDFDLIITVAGVSLGSADNTPIAMASLELEELFHGVAIRPGGPVMLSLHQASGTPVLSLPGNPMASAACMRSFGSEILRALDGLSQVDEREENATGWVELDLASSTEETAWTDWLERLKPGMSTFAALPATGDRGPPTLQGAISAGRRTGPCALGSLIDADAWVRADRASAGGVDRVFWRAF
ncbi:hypothetical protein JCM10908_007283 [Rhodotorula pacifica]|uniref:uncharacterized protein n=1 Tax=Rhodotorula pacifica TaxID=1495444 RepID=UPI00317E91AA